MPLIFVKRYVRDDAVKNPGVLYVFGDNTLRKGFGGQAGEMRGEPNAVGVATKYFPSMDSDAFFGEEPAQIEAQKRILDEDMKPLFEHLVSGGVVIWPADGLGTGLSALDKHAPTTLEYLETKVLALREIAELFSRGRLNSAKKLAGQHG